MGLREVLAELDVKVRGLGDVDAAKGELDRYVDATKPAISKFEALRVKQGEASEVAGRLIRRIRKLQKAEGDHSREISRLRVAFVRIKEESRGYGREADKARGIQDQTAGSAGTLTQKYAKVAGALAVVAAATAGAQKALRATIDLFAEMIDLGDELERTSSRLGISSDALQEWRFIANRSNVTADELQSALGAMSEKAESGRGPWERLGVSIRDAAGELRPQEELFEQTILSLGRIEDATTRARIAQQVFGSSSEALEALIDSGGESIEELRARFEELGGGLSEDLVEGSAAAEDAMEDFRLATLGVKNALVVDFLPVVGRLITETATIVAGIGELIRTSSVLETALGALTVAAVILAIGMAPILVPAVLGIAAFGLFLLAVEDVVTAFRGGESVFGGWVEAFFEMLGVTITFEGILERFGIAWQLTKVVVLDSIAEILEAMRFLQDSLGIESQLGDTIQGLRSGRNAAQGQANLLRKTSQANEVARFADRRTAEIERSGSAKGETTVNATITVNGGGDPEATARAVRRELTSAMRGAIDGEPLAEPA